MAAERYGLKVSGKGMACCPFHRDRHPSMKLNEDYFFCFGCGARGDVIDLAAKLLGIGGYEAAHRLTSDVGVVSPCSEDKSGHRPVSQPTLYSGEQEELCFRVLREYGQLLQDWKLRYAPISPESEPDPRFAESCRMLEHIRYMADVLRSGEPVQRAALVQELTREGRITAWQAIVKKEQGGRERFGKQQSEYRKNPVRLVRRAEYQ